MVSAQTARPQGARPVPVFFFGQRRAGPHSTSGERGRAAGYYRIAASRASTTTLGDCVEQGTRGCAQGLVGNSAVERHCARQFVEVEARATSLASS